MSFVRSAVGQGLRGRTISYLLAIVTLTGAPLGAQTLGSGSIQGTITDESGAPMPGVTVNASGPALQVPQITVVSAADGGYRFPTLPVGTYALSYELSGFQKVIRQDQRLNAGFVATINVVMKVGSLEESVTVVGKTPVVDIKTTAGQTNVTTEMLENTPVSRTWNNILAMAAGVRVNAPDVGGSSTGDSPSYSAYGVGGQNTPTIEGLNTREGNSAAGFYYDYAAFEEVQVKALGNGAEVGTPGTNFVGIVKSGGNEFHGRYFFAGHTDKLPMQSSNLDADLRAKGVSEGTRLVNYSDVSADLGGRIIRDKLWFYGAILDQRNKRTRIGYSKAPGPDGRYGTEDDVQGFDPNLVPNQSLKVSYQASDAYKVIGFLQHNKRATLERDGSRFAPFEHTYNYDFAPTAAKVELQATPTSKLLVNVLGGYVWYWTNFREQEGMDRKGNPSTRDLTTGYTLGPPERIYRSFRRHWQTTGSVTYYASGGKIGGSHELKVGYQLDWEHRSSGIEPDRASGNYVLIFDNGAPLQIVTKDLPNDSSGSRMTDYAAYVQDTWSLGRRLTLNLGLRAEQYHNWVDEVTKEQGQFGGSGTYPGVDIFTWNSLAPRFGIAYDLTGDARTVVKGTAGVYYFNPGVDFSVNYNRGGTTNTTYRWRDQNGNRDYDPGEVNLAPNGPDFISQSGPTTLLLNPDLKSPKTYEYSASLERELATNLSVKVAYVFKTLKGDIANINALRPYDVYDVAITRQDPGPDGVLGTGDDGGIMTIYDYSAAYRGGAFVATMPVNRPGDRTDTYKTIEFTAIKRRTNNFDVMFSYGATKNHRWITSIATSPNDDIFPLDETWQWQSKLAASYTAPYGIQLGAWWQGLSGAKFQRTYVFRGLPQSGTLTMRMEEFGNQSLPALHTVNIRAGKRFNLARYKLEFAVDMFNAFNANTVTGSTFVSGPTYGSISSIFSPRILRLGTTFSF
jgi:hypothetical protein